MTTAAIEPREFFAWFSERAEEWCTKPWLLLGKGPTFSRLSEVDKDAYFTLGLNHVVLQTKLTLCHAIDIDVIAQCAGILEQNAQYVVMPWFPHENNQVGERSLLQWMEEMPVLQRLASAGRLIWYNASTAAAPNPGSPVVSVMYFSAEAALNLLAQAGIRHVRTLGIDGGASYSGEFSTIGTLLANGRSSFNKQFGQIAKTIMAHDLDFAPYGVDAPVRVFVAATDAQMLAVNVLSYSIRKQASISVEVIPLHRTGIEMPVPREQKNWPRTPFSFQRFMIPEACGYRGRAIYFDSDMQVFTDIRELWETPFQGNALLSAQDEKEGGRKPQYSVMLLDCSRLHWKCRDIVEALDDGSLSYESLMYEMSVAPEQAALISPEWNSLERYRESSTKLLHYTDMDTQPWIHAKHPYGYVWCRDLIAAINDGFIDKALLDEHVAKHWVRPSLRYQVEHDIEDPLLLPREALLLDKDFVPPFVGIHRHGARPWVSLRAAILAMMRRVYFLSPLPMLQRRLRVRRERFE